MSIPRRTGYDPEVADQLLRLFKAEEIRSDPLLSALADLADLESVRRKYSLSDIKRSYRGHTLRFHPDRNLDKSKEDQIRYALFFGKLTEIYHSIIDLQLSTSLVTVDTTIPYSIRHGYHPIVDYDDDVMIDRKGVPLETSDSLYGMAKIVVFFKYLSGYSHESIFRRADIVKNREEIERFLQLEAANRLNEELEQFECVLNYGYEYTPLTTEEGIKIPHEVSIKHLEKRKVFDAPPNEWIVVDREFVIRVGYLKGKTHKLETPSSSNSIAVSADIATNRGDIVTYHKKYSDGQQLLVSIEPSTMAMRTDDGWLFVAKNPYHKYLLPRGHFLIPTEKYVDSKGTAIVDPKFFSLPVKAVDDYFEDILDPTKFGIYVPWVCLSPEAIETLRNYKIQSLDKIKELPKT
jgi:hypothetical protein